MQFDVKVISSNCDFMFDMFFKDAKASSDIVVTALLFWNSKAYVPYSSV